jgi:hypothetical protein
MIPLIWAKITVWEVLMMKTKKEPKKEENKRPLGDKKLNGPNRPST